MREYRIKRGHHPDLNTLVSQYYGAKGDIEKGMQFSVEGIGDITIKHEKDSLMIDIVPPKKISGDFSIIKKWNQFLFDTTGMDVKERKKQFGKV